MTNMSSSSRTCRLSSSEIKLSWTFSPGRIPTSSIGTVGRDGGDEVHDAHARDLRHEDLAAPHQLGAADGERDALLERDPEARHGSIGHRHAAGGALRGEERDHAAAAADDVAVAHHARARCRGGDRTRCPGRAASRRRAWWRRRDSAGSRPCRSRARSRASRPGRSPHRSRSSCRGRWSGWPRTGCTRTPGSASSPRRGRRRRRRAWRARAGRGRGRRPRRSGATPRDRHGAAPSPTA